MIKINFICIGAAKSGTTAMHFFLRQHPQIYMPLKKEIHHFADDILKKNDYWLKPEAFFKLFRKAKNKQIIGETSVFYMISENAAKNIYSHNPDAKIIIMLRNPVEVAYSLHSQLVFNGEENINDFKKVLEIEQDRINGKKLPTKTRINKKHIYTEVVKYTVQIKRFQNFFPPENIKIILFEDFKNNALNTVQQTYKFLEVDDKFKPKLKVHNPNKKIKNRNIQKFTTFFTNRILSKFFCEDNLEKFRNFMIKINSIEKKRKPLDNETKQILTEKLKPEIIKLEKLLNKNLKHWYE